MLCLKEFLFIYSPNGIFFKMICYNNQIKLSQWKTEKFKKKQCFFQFIDSNKFTKLRKCKLGKPVNISEKGNWMTSEV